MGQLTNTYFPKELNIGTSFIPNDIFMSKGIII